MKLVKENPASLFLVLFVMAFVAIVALQVIITVNQKSSQFVAKVQMTPSTSNQMATTINLDVAPSSLTTQITPVATSPLLGVTNIRFGVTDRYVDCHVASQIARLAVEQELELESTLIVYNTVDELFTALAQGEIDLTLCYLDPGDRRRIRGENKERFGNHMKQIGSYYWDLGSSKLQIWSNGQASADWREQMPCLISFFENFRFTDQQLQQKNAEAWLKNHTNEVQAWVSCVP